MYYKEYPVLVICETYFVYCIMYLQFQRQGVVNLFCFRPLLSYTRAFAHKHTHVLVKRVSTQTL